MPLIFSVMLYWSFWLTGLKHHSIYFRTQCYITIHLPKGPVSRDLIVTLGSILDSQVSWESGKFQLARWSHEVVLKITGPPTHPAVNRTCNLYWDTVLICGVPPPGTLFRKYVYTFSVRCPPPKFSSVPWTLWLCLGFWAKLRIWQVPACKMKPSSTCILECGTPSWACLFYVMLVIR